MAGKIGKSSRKIMMRHPGGGVTLKRKVRKHTATIIEHEKGPRGGETHYRFPMPDKAHARNALARLSQAKGLSGREKAKIRRRASRMLYGKSYSTSTVKKARSMLKRRRS